MSTKDDPSQGMVRDPAKPEAHEIPEPNGVAILRKIGTQLDRDDAETYKPRPPQQVGGKQDWRKG